VDLNQIVRETAEAFGRTRKQITIHLDLADKLAAIEADQTQIEQVLLNLYVNAADAMPGGGQLFIRSAFIDDGDLKDKSYNPKPGRYVLLEVKDQGIGMDKRTMERIFDPFFTTKEMGRGTGLGLASAYGIIKAHNGYIDVDSKPGQGAVFCIYLPATDRKIEKVTQVNGTVKIGHGTVLIVDDEESVLDISAQMLNRSGYTVITAGGGRQALDIFAEKWRAIDLVVLDLVMPDISGRQAYEEMKRIHPRVKVLLSSGYSLDRQAKQIMDKGCNGFIQKPFNMSQLTGIVEEILKRP
jgi:two-component system cell cycle sensor histidine kinase/response regulator CckA